MSHPIQSPTPTAIDTINVERRYLNKMVWRNLHKQIGLPFNESRQIITLSLAGSGFRWLCRNDPRFLPPFQQRMVREHAELRERREKLLAYIRENPDFQKLDSDEQRLMIEQQNHMSRYEEALAQRINRFLA